MKVYVVHIAALEKKTVEMVTSDYEKAVKKQIELYEKHGPWNLIEVKEMEVE